MLLGKTIALFILYSVGSGFSIAYAADSDVTFKRIISLAPHTTELAYAVGIGERIVAVSEHSDYPEDAKSLPRVASHLGVNFEALMRLKPDLILAWQGGNKPQDLAKLKRLGYQLFISAPHSPFDIPNDIRRLGALTGVRGNADSLARELENTLNELDAWSAQRSKPRVFYYMWPEPMMTIGENAWANSLLRHCNATNIFADSTVDYPSVSLEQVIKRQPDVIIAAMNTTTDEMSTFWRSWEHALSLDFLVVNPDEVHRFTPRLIPALASFCRAIHGKSTK